MKRVLISIALVTIAVCIGLYKAGYDSGVSNGYKRGITYGKIMRNEEIEKEVKNHMYKSGSYYGIDGITVDYYIKKR
ncbi:MAG: hypothetical protein ACLRW1_03760 [Clostridia bacterium]